MPHPRPDEGERTLTGIKPAAGLTPINASTAAGGFHSFHHESQEDGMDYGSLNECSVTADHSAIAIDGRRPAWVNIGTSAAAYEIVTHLGVADEDDVAVDVADRVLTVAAKHCVETCRSIGGFLLVDHRDNAIEQNFSLPGDADEDDITLHLHMGVLRIVIGRREFGQPVDLSAWRAPRSAC